MQEGGEEEKRRGGGGGILLEGREVETKESLRDDLESDPKDLREELDTKESLEDALELADEVVEGGEAVSRWAGM